MPSHDTTVRSRPRKRNLIARAAQLIFTKRMGMQRTWRIVALGMFLVALAPSTALAAGDDILAPRFDLGIWTLVIFVILLLVLRKFAWGPMLEGLRKREETIRGSVEEARRTRDDMEQLRAQFKVEMDQAYAKIPALMDDARRDAERMTNDLRSKATADISAERQRLRHEMDVARDQALHELWTNAAQLATLISAKAIGRSLSEEDHRRLLDEALQEIRQTTGA
jgi:F-type H+-transporting ATPase subunit b